MAVAVDPSGRFVYATNWTGATIQVYSIDQTSGSLTASGRLFERGRSPAASR